MKTKYLCLNNRFWLPTEEIIHSSFFKEDEVYYNTYETHKLLIKGEEEPILPKVIK